MTVVRALALIAFMIPAIQYDKAHENDPALPGGAAFSLSLNETFSR
jgi:hypothetical protein